jgi:DNA-binding XRE family transcriptional regulator
MKGAIKFSDYLKEALKNKAVRKAFEEEEIYANLAIQIAKLRESEGLTQQDLARLLNTTQQTISRLEDAKNTSLSIATLIKLAQTFHKNLRIRFV